MTYPYVIFSDGTEVVHTQEVEEDGIQKVHVYFERPTANGFDEARCYIPGGEWYHRRGFSEDELAVFRQFVERNADLIRKAAQMYTSDIRVDTVSLHCHDGAETLVFKRYHWTKLGCDFEISLDDAYCGGDYMGIKGRFKRALHAFLARPVYYSSIYCTNKTRLRKFLLDCLVLVDE